MQAKIVTVLVLVTKRNRNAWGREARRIWRPVTWVLTVHLFNMTTVTVHCGVEFTGVIAENRTEKERMRSCS